MLLCHAMPIITASLSSRLVLHLHIGQACWRLDLTYATPDGAVRGLIQFLVGQANRRLGSTDTLKLLAWR